MPLIVMADDGVGFDGGTPAARPLGGAEAAFLALAEALAARGHTVQVRNNCAAPMNRNGVEWTPIAAGVPESCDLYIANRGHRLIGLAAKARGRAFWLHNPGDYILKPRYLWPLFMHRPVLVFSGQIHANTVPGWVPSGGRVIVPYGLDAAYRSAGQRTDTPPPIAIFTSNPLRGLDWLLDLWERRIRPTIPTAELHVYAGPQVYGAVGDRKAAEMAKVLARAETLASLGVRRHAPVPKSQLMPPLRAARAMLYRGDIGESFCLAVAEAQALGLPAVVTKLGSLPERVVDGVTGTIAAGEDDFCAAAVAILLDDALWRRQHAAAVSLQKGIAWDEAAARFEALIP